MDSFQLPRVPLCSKLPGGGRVAGSEPWVSGHPSGTRGGGDAGIGAFDNQGALELGRGPEDMQGEAPGWRAGIDGVAQGAEVGAALGEAVEQLHQVHERPGQAVQAHHDEGIACGDAAEQPGQGWAGFIGAGAVFLDDFGATGLSEFPDLGGTILVVGGDAGVSDQYSWGGLRGGWVPLVQPVGWRRGSRRHGQGVVAHS